MSENKIIFFFKISGKSLRRNLFFFENKLLSVPAGSIHTIRLDQLNKFQEFLQGEVRYASLAKQFPAEAHELFAAAEGMAKKRYASYQRMAKLDWSKEETAE